MQCLSNYIFFIKRQNYWQNVIIIIGKMLVVVMCKYKTWETFPKNEGLSLRDIKAKFSTEQA